MEEFSPLWNELGLSYETWGETVGEREVAIAAVAAAAAAEAEMAAVAAAAAAVAAASAAAASAAAEAEVVWRGTSVGLAAVRAKPPVLEIGHDLFFHLTSISLSTPTVLAVLGCGQGCGQQAAGSAARPSTPAAACKRYPAAGPHGAVEAGEKTGSLGHVRIGPPRRLPCRSLDPRGL